MKHIRFLSIFLCAAILLSAMVLVSCDIEESNGSDNGTQNVGGTDNSGKETSADDKFAPVQGGEGTRGEDGDKGGESSSDTGKKDDETVKEPDNETAKETVPYERDDLFESSQMDFAVSLLKETAKQREDDSSMLISPTSVMVALAMTANGARGETREDMEKVLGMSIDELNEALKKYILSLPSSKDAKLHVANSIWIREYDGLTVKESFINKTQQFYSAAPYLEPFDSTTVDKINQWAEQNTDGMIKKLIEEIDPLEMMHLINAVCFDAVWAEQYPDESVREGSFTNADGSVVSVQMMSGEDGTYIENENATGFIKSYKGGYSFVAILPKDGVSVYDYIASLSASELDGLLHNRQYGYALNTKLPKFSYEYSVNMNDILTDMGIDNCFIGQPADFTDMADCVDGPLKIGAVLHKTKIEVDQGGTRAAAITDVIMYPECAPSREVSVILDRSFLFMIIHNESMLPVFMGAVSNIEGEQIGQKEYKIPTKKEYVRIDWCGEVTDELASLMENTDGKPYIRIDNMDELAALTAVLEKDDAWFDLNFKEDSTSYRELCKGLDAGFFEKNSLIIPYITEGSGSIRHRVDLVYVDSSSDPSTLVIDLTAISPYGFTDDMAGWFICIGLAKDDLDFGGRLEIIRHMEYVDEY